MTDFDPLTELLALQVRAYQAWQVLVVHDEDAAEVLLEAIYDSFPPPKESKAA